MLYFSKPRKFSAHLRKCDARNKKIKQSAVEGGGDAGTQLKIILTMDAAVTPTMQKSMSPAVQAWIAANVGSKAGEEAIEKAVPAKMKPFYAIAKFFNEGDKEPTIARGGDNDARVQVGVEKYFILEGEAFMQVRAVCDFCTELWAWCGSHLDRSHSAVALEVKPLQKELNLDGKEDEDDE